MFIVLEGVDGSGKSTQIAKLRGMLDEQGIPNEYIHFPRFDAPFFGELIARFLRGELGSVEQVDPYIVAMLYAGDRHDAKRIIDGWLAEGKVVICDRYVYSNIGYQCAKVPDTEGRDRLKEWIFDLEYNHFAIPRPDVSLFLDVPFAFTERKLQETRVGDDRDYLNGGKDIHEQSLELQQMVRQVYLDAAQQDTAMHIVDCSDGQSTMASPDVIFSRVMEQIAPYLNPDK